MSSREFSITLHRCPDGGFGFNSRDIDLKYLHKTLSNGIFKEIHKIREDISKIDGTISIKKGFISSFLGYESAIFLSKLFLDKID